MLGVAAGHECTLYHLANRSALTIATDLYRGDTMFTSVVLFFEKRRPHPLRRLSGTLKGLRRSP